MSRRNLLGQCALPGRRSQQIRQLSHTVLLVADHRLRAQLRPLRLITGRILPIDKRNQQISKAKACKHASSHISQYFELHFQEVYCSFLFFVCYFPNAAQTAATCFAFLVLSPLFYLISKDASRHLVQNQNISSFV